MVKQDSHPAGMDTFRRGPGPGIPTQFQASYRLWLVAVAAGGFETALAVVDATSGDVGSAAQVTVGVAVRLLALTGLVDLAVQLRQGMKWAPGRPGGAVWRDRRPLPGDRSGHLAGRGGIAQRRRGGGGARVGAVRGQPGRAPGGGDRGGGADVPPDHQRLHPSNQTGCRPAREAIGPDAVKPSLRPWTGVVGGAGWRRMPRAGRARRSRGSDDVATGHHDHPGAGGDDRG